MDPIRETYWSAVRQGAVRLLSLLDRNPSSSTFGCFDRAFWLHRKTDFATSTAQLSVYSLALLYRSNFSGNPLFQKKSVLGWIEGSIWFTLGLQHADGSFDEWYPNERGWAGPTGYIAQALLDTLELLEQELSPRLKARIEECLLKAAFHLAKRDEGEILANHYAIALAPMAGISARSGSPKLKEAVDFWVKKFHKLVTDEGWSLEYDGCDLGYNLGTLSFLGRIHRRNGDPIISQYARKSFQFLSHFAFPDGTWAGSLGSRHTSHSYPFALEYWAGILPEARPLLRHQRAALRDGVSLVPSDQEDHYIHYRLAEYIQAAAAPFPGPLEGCSLPYEAADFDSAYFPGAGMRVQKIKCDPGLRHSELLLWSAERRGGAIRIYSLPSKSLLLANAGCMLKQPGGEVVTSLWQSGPTADTPEGVVAHAPLYRIFTRRFTPFSFLLFRICCQIMVFPSFAYWFKLWIRRKMITTRDKCESKWIRRLELTKDHLILRDAVSWRERAPWAILYYGGEFHTRYVPQAQYFSPVEAEFAPVLFNPADFKDPENLRIKQSLSLHTGMVEVCVE